MSKVTRKTKETAIEVRLGLGGRPGTIQTPDPFFTHMLTTLSRYAGWSLTLKVESHDAIGHHAVEDAAIALGRVVRQRVEAAPVARFGRASVVMDDAWVDLVVDVGGRAYYDGRLPMPMMEHAIRSFAFESGATLHVDVRRGRDEHHVVEAAFKALGMALKQALAPADATQSTKGDVDYGQ